MSDLRPLVLLTDAIAPNEQNRLAQWCDLRVCAPASPDFQSIAQHASAIIVRNPLAPALFDDAPLLRAVVRHGAGLDMIPVEHATHAAVAVANVPSVNAVTVAEHAVGQMLALTRQLPMQNQKLRDEGWTQARHIASGSKDLRSKTIVIVGLGDVGSALARICDAGFGMQVIGVRRNTNARHEHASLRSLEQALPVADFLVLACPLTNETRQLINTGRLAQLKRGAFLVNVSRGAVVDEAALVAALRDGHLAGAALDVFVEQPLPSTSPLRGFQQVLLTPHTAGISEQSMQAMGAGSVDQVLQALAGQLPRNLVNRDAAQRIQQRWAQMPPLQFPSSLSLFTQEVL